jgi:hypothetical protein
MGKGKTAYIGRSYLGRTVVSGVSFDSGDLVAEIKGEVVFDPDYGSDYCMDLGVGCVLEPDPPFRYLNHSCEPNCELLICDDEDQAVPLRLCLFATQKIQPGDELTIDYAWAADSAIPCQCGSRACRGWIVAATELSSFERSKSVA